MNPLASQRADPEEIARLAALDASWVLDTSAEPGFDDIVQLAAQVCGTTVALISLLDRDRRWFEAPVGLDLCPRSLAQSLCALVLTQTGLLVIPDLSKDARTRHDVLVAGPPHLRFYAGIRLETPEGAALGTLCVADGVPRPAGLPSEQRSGLEALGRQVTAQLALHRALMQRDAAEALWHDTAVRPETVVGIRRAIGVGESGLGTSAREEDLIGGLRRQSSRPDRVVDSDMLTAQLRPGEDAVRRAREAGQVGTVDIDVATRQAADTAAAAQRRQRLATEAAGIGLWDYDPVSGLVHQDDLCRAMFGLPPGSALTLERHLEAIHPEDRAAAAAALEQALDPAGSGKFRIAYRVEGGQGEPERWIAASGHVMVGSDGAAQVLGIAQDITRQKHNETRQAALVELGDALRDLDRTRDIAWTAARIMGHALGVDRVGYGTVDAVQQTIEIPQDWTVPGMVSVAGLHRFVAAGTLLEELELGRPVVVDDAADVAPSAADTGTFAGLGARAMLNVPILEHGRLVAIVFLHHRVRRAWGEEEVGFVRNAGDRVRAALARVRAEEEQRLVNRELGHRLKNTLAMVQAIASQTLRNAPTLELAREALSARLVALGRAHDILLSGGDDRAPLRTLVTGSLALAGDLRAERFTIAGPDLVIGPKAALSVSLMIHELATNAVKYGALSRPEGRVDILWSVDARDDREMFHMGWSERCGPPVAPPARRGFGSRLIERGLAGAVGGAMALRFEPDGVRCTLDAPLSAMMAES